MSDVKFYHVEVAVNLPEIAFVPTSKTITTNWSSIFSESFDQSNITENERQQTRMPRTA